MSGTGTAAAAAILLIGLVVGLMLAEPSLDKAVDELRSSREEAAEMSLGLANSRISITSVVYNNTTMELNTSITNDGSTVVDLLDLDLILNGTWKDWTPGVNRYIYPSKDLLVSIGNVTDPRSVMVVDRFGISDQTEDIVTVS